jgi:hypothetical protein
MSTEVTTSYVSAKDTLLRAELPQQTKTYKPISHTQLIDLTLNGIHNAGFKLDSETYSAARDGQVANGRFSIANVADSEMQLQIGWQNSYDKSLTLKFAIGTKIFICQNGCVSGDMGAFKRKHVGEIQDFTPGAITEYIKSAGEAFRRMQKEREQMKQVEITSRTKAEIIGRMFLEDQIITSTQLNIIGRELKAPTHDYGAKDSMWELYNYTTFAMKEVHPSFWLDKHMSAHSFFVNESGILVDQMPKIEIVPEGMLRQLDLFGNDINNVEYAMGQV